MNVIDYSYHPRFHRLAHRLADGIERRLGPWTPDESLEDHELRMLVRDLRDEASPRRIIPESRIEQLYGQEAQVSS